MVSPPRGRSRDYDGRGIFVCTAGGNLADNEGGRHPSFTSSESGLLNSNPQDTKPSLVNSEKNARIKLTGNGGEASMRERIYALALPHGLSAGAVSSDRSLKTAPVGNLRIWLSFYILMRFMPLSSPTHAWVPA